MATKLETPIYVARNLIKLKLGNSELDLSVIAFLIQLRGTLKELVLTGNSIHFTRNIDLGERDEAVPATPALEANKKFFEEPLSTNYSL